MSRQNFEKIYKELGGFPVGLTMSWNGNSYLVADQQYDWELWQAAIEYQKSETNYKQQLQVLQSAESERMYWVGRNEQKEKDAGICQDIMNYWAYANEQAQDASTQFESEYMYSGAEQCAKAIREGE